MVAENRELDKPITLTSWNRFRENLQCYRRRLIEARLNLGINCGDEEPRPGTLGLSITRRLNRVFFDWPVLFGLALP